MISAFIYVSAFVFADPMALLCFFCGSVIDLWLGGSRLVCFCLLCSHRFIFMEMQSLGAEMQSAVLCCKRFFLSVCEITFEFCL